MGKKYTCRRFILAFLFAIVSCGCVIAGIISGGEFCSIAGVVLGIYGGADVINKRDKMKHNEGFTG